MQGLPLGYQADGAAATAALAAAAAAPPLPLQGAEALGELAVASTAGGWRRPGWTRQQYVAAAAERAAAGAEV